MIMIICRTKHALPATLLMINQYYLVRVNSYKYLGVWLTPLLIGQHRLVRFETKQGRKWAFFMIISITMQTAQHLQIRPHLEYAVAVTPINRVLSTP